MKYIGKIHAGHASYFGQFFLFIFKKMSWILAYGIFLEDELHDTSMLFS